MWNDVNYLFVGNIWYSFYLLHECMVLLCIFCSYGYQNLHGFHRRMQHNQHLYCMSYYNLLNCLRHLYVALNTCRQRFDKSHHIYRPLRNNECNILFLFYQIRMYAKMVYKKLYFNFQYFIRMKFILTTSSKDTKFVSRTFIALIAFY